MRLIVVLVALTATLACGQSYRSAVVVDPMTGETVRRMPALRLYGIEGHTPDGQALLTGSSQGLTITDITVAQYWTQISVNFVSSYGTGLLSGGQASTCMDPELRVNLDGYLYWIRPTGTSRTDGAVVGRTYGQATSGVQSSRQSFVFEGNLNQHLHAARTVLFEYCDIVVQVEEDSLAELQGRFADSRRGPGRLE